MSVLHKTKIYSGVVFGSYDTDGGIIKSANGENGPTVAEVNEYFKLPTRLESWKKYVVKSIQYLIGGRYNNDGTMLATGFDMALAVFGADIYSDLRDTVYFADNWEWTKDCYFKAGLLTLSVLPLVGAVKKGMEAVSLACTKFS